MLKLVATLTAVFALGCAPPQNFYFKEKLTDHHTGDPRPGINTDRFTFNRPFGPVDVLFVVDNSDRLDYALQKFQASYARFLSLWTKPENASKVHALDFHIQVVSSPTNRMPKNLVSASAPAAVQLAQLFGPPGSVPEPIFVTDPNQRAPQGATPVSSTLFGLASDDLKDRSAVPLFLFYLMGQDLGEGETDLSKFTNAVGTSRGFFQVHGAFLSRRSDPSSGSFPSCFQFTPPTKALIGFSSVQWRASQFYDLCDPNWSAWEDDFFQKIIDFKTRQVLSKVPVQPELMTLRGASRLYRYGQDFHWEGSTNEIVFDVSSGLIDGDLIEVAYYTSLVSNPLPGNPTPETPGTGLPHPTPSGSPRPPVAPGSR